MSTRNYFRLVWTALLAMTAAACMDRPRNNQVLSSPKATFQWSGWVVNPNETVTLKVKDQSDGSWDTRWNATTGTTGQTDGQLTWFPFSTSSTTLRYSTASSNRKYWRMISSQGSQRRMAADVKTTSPTRGDLFSFDADADSCITSQSTGMAIAGNCSSSSSPVATLIANCGKPDQACCLANGVGTIDRCDRGRNCDTSSLTCSIPAGGLHQACFADNTCNNSTLECVDGLCRDMIQRAPVLTSKLVVHTCDKAYAGTHEEIWVRLRNDTFYLDHPGRDADRNQTDTWGLAIPDIHSVSDISGLTIGTEQGEDSWCVDRVDLIVNGAKVFSKSYSGGIEIRQVNDPIYPIFPQLKVADETTIRDALDAADRTQVCTLPPSLSYADLESEIAGALGDKFARSRLNLTSDDKKYNASWGNFSPIVTREDSNTLKVAIKFRATAILTDPIPDFDITGDIEIKVSAQCSVEAQGWSNPNGTSGFSQCKPDFNSSAVLTKAVGIPDTGVPVLEDIVRWIASVKIAGAAQKAVSQFPDLESYFDDAQAFACPFDVSHQLCDPDGNVCSCPNINVGSSSIRLDWTSLSSLPNLLCLF